jgi:DNA excision repair protein ERCC-3
MVDLQNPLIIQSDNSILLETTNEKFESARDEISQFAELIKSPEYIHTYRLTPLSLWNSASVGFTSQQVVDILNRYSKYEIPNNVFQNIRDNIEKYGKLKLSKEDDKLVLQSTDPYTMTEITHQKSIQPFIDKKIDDLTLYIKLDSRGRLKQSLLKLGYPVQDVAGYVDGDSYNIELRNDTLKGKSFAFRKYQIDAIHSFHKDGSNLGGSGVIVLPCGAGKTIIGIGIMEKLKMHTLVLGTNIIALRQWRDELFDKTTLSDADVGEYSGEKKEIKPITLSTYQIMTHRKSKESDFKHFALFNERNWGLIIYDEVHLLPAPVFRIVADIQSKRRLGLTATLVREDGKEEDVFSLIGPKKFDLPWKILEEQGWIATADCTEIRLDLPDKLKLKYATAERRDKYKIASTNPQKINIIKKIITQHSNDNILIIGQYLDQLHIISEAFNVPIITGATANKERERLYGDFKNGKIKMLIVSKVANFAIDLPDANVAIQISGTFGSRQEEAQRLGRILRPKQDENQAHFYSIVTRNTLDQDYASKRQLFLTEQGYKYSILSG